MDTLAKKSLKGYVSTSANLSGNISGTVTLKGGIGTGRARANYVSVSDDDNGNVKVIGVKVKKDFDENVILTGLDIISGLNVYHGEHVIKPKLEDQTIKTADKYVSDDIQVTAIPIYEVSNDAGGETFIIAKE